MPSLNASDVFMFIMASPWRQIPDPVGWRNPDTLACLGLVHGPSSDPSAPIPVGLKRQESIAISNFIDACIAIPEDERQAFIVSGGTHQTARDDYKKWFRHHVSKKLNFVIDSALKEADKWPPQLLAEQEEDEWCGLLPVEAAPIVGPAIFGEVVMNGSRVLTRVLPSIITILSHTNRRHRKLYDKAEQSLLGHKGEKGIVAQLKEAVDVLESSDTVDLPAIRAATKLLVDCRKYTLWRPSVNDSLAETDALLQGIVEAAGTLMIPPTRPTRKADTGEKVQAARARGKAKKLPTAQLADEREVAATIDMLVDHFNESPEGPVTDSAVVDDSIVWDKVSDEAGDLGVEKFSGHTEDHLHTLLDFPAGRPVTWSKFRDADQTISAWNSDDAERYEKGGEGMKPVALMWHQLVGVASIVDKSFLPEGSDRTGDNAVPGVLLADAVGVGKTAQVMAYITFIRSLWACETKNEGAGRPPIVKDKPSFMGRGPVPNDPHLIIVPNSLVEQWIRELYAFNRKGSLDVFRLPVSANDVARFFLQEDSPWKKSKHEPINRVIISSDSTFCTLAAARWQNTAALKGKAPDAPRVAKVGAGARIFSIFDIDFSVTVIDEIHGFRGRSSRGFVGGNEIRRRSRQIIGVSATPYLNQPQSAAQ
ncbi:hypothetical protein M413DRAFT_30621 [Hebeloma cylindrosporum]|uniref:Helicase ATP-binding domain-containing protein n=1 Tax=Hebeloma cylindrosporum TaxID=76867 RepID=A0A0C3BLV7_HEBCY|nr:hypothetical protein M413DRAFT_30621 [Hebeloma cylindrosporum h7]